LYRYNWARDNFEDFMELVYQQQEEDHRQYEERYRQWHGTTPKHL
jgi:hypothetical protein